MKKILIMVAASFTITTSMQAADPPGACPTSAQVANAIMATLKTHSADISSSLKLSSGTVKSSIVNDSQEAKNAISKGLVNAWNTATNGLKNTKTGQTTTCTYTYNSGAPIFYTIVINEK